MWHLEAVCNVSYKNPIIFVIFLPFFKGSKFYENQLKKEAVLQRHIAEQQKRIDRLSPAQIDEGVTEVINIYFHMSM